MLRTLDRTGRQGIRLSTMAASRVDLLKRIERWTYWHKIKLCRGLRAKVIIARDAIVAHDLTQDEIDLWMEAYKKRDFEALKIGNGRKRRMIVPSWAK